MTTPTPEKILCPVCGSAELTARNDKRTIGDRFTGSILIDEIIYVCSNCGAEGDFANQNDDTYKRAVEAMSATAMSKMFEALSAKGITAAELERKLALPQRTTARWKRDGASAAATTLIKTVITYPWMLEVAKTNFDPNVANQTLMLESFKLAENWAKSLRINSNFMTGVFKTPDQPVFNISFEVNAAQCEFPKNTDSIYRSNGEFFHSQHGQKFELKKEGVKIA